MEMNEDETLRWKRGTRSIMRTLKVERHETRAHGPKEYETEMVQPRNKNDRIWTALRLKMEGIEQELEEME